MYFELRHVAANKILATAKLEETEDSTVLQVRMHSVVSGAKQSATTEMQLEAGVLAFASALAIAKSPTTKQPLMTYINSMNTLVHKFISRSTTLVFQKTSEEIQNFDYCKKFDQHIRPLVSSSSSSSCALQRQPPLLKRQQILPDDDEDDEDTNTHGISSKQ